MAERYGYAHLAESLLQRRRSILWQKICQGKADQEAVWKGIAHKISDKFFELPISNLSIKNPLSFEPSAFSPGRNKKKRIVLPWGGGGYFRLVPYRLFRRGVQSILENDGAYAFYFHPWELDPGQPRVKAASMNYKFRHHAGLNGTSEKLQKLTREFSHCGFITCSHYLELNGGLLI